MSDREFGGMLILLIQFYPHEANGERRGAALASPIYVKWRHGVALETRRRGRWAVPFALPLHRSCPLGVTYADSVLGNDDLSLPKGIAYYFLYILNIAGSA